MARKKEIKFTLRIYDGQLLNCLDELVEKGRFKSRNDVINVALKRAVPGLYKQEFDKKAYLTQRLMEQETEERSDVLERLLREMQRTNRTLDEVFIVQTISERLLATLYNVKHAEVEGVNVNSEMFASSILAELPDEIQDIKRELLEAYKEED